MKRRSTKRNGVVSTDPVTKLTMSSVEIAERVGKRHCDVMRSIRTMEPAWAKISLRKFASSTYKDDRGNKYPVWMIDDVLEHELNGCIE